MKSTSLVRATENRQAGNAAGNHFVICIGMHAAYLVGCSFNQSKISTNTHPMHNDHIIVRVRHLTHDSHFENNAAFPIQRICGYLDVPDFCKLMYTAENKVNPRNARENSVVKKIRETLETSPEQFWIKSRGILIATQECTRLDRNRVRLSFGKIESEGIMDGGHNTLAIASFLMNSLLDINYRRSSEWKECKKLWQEHYTEIEQALKNNISKSGGYSFLIPIEIIAPLNSSVQGISAIQEEESRSYYRAYLPDICSARNTNVQLKDTAKDNQLGLYDILKDYVPDPNAIEWKTGDNKSGVPCEDIVALACLPLWKLISEGTVQLDSRPSFNIKSLYSQKGKCVDFYNKVITDKEVSDYNQGKYYIKNEQIISALCMVGELMSFFDRLYLIFPDMYNQFGSFGRISSVKTGKESEVHFKTTSRKCDKSYPDGYIYPLICGVVSLMKFNEKTNRLEWIKAPSSICDDVLINKGYQTSYFEVIRILNYDPQKVGKDHLSYQLATAMFDEIVRKEYILHSDDSMEIDEVKTNLPTRNDDTPPKTDINMSSIQHNERSGGGRFHFSEVGIKVGELLKFKYEGIYVRVADDSNIEYDGKKYSLTGFVKKFLPEDQRCNSESYRGPEYFTYKEKNLIDIKKENNGITR